MTPVETLERWHDFFVLVGTFGATLLALMFVAVSLAMDEVPPRALFSVPWSHFPAVFFISALALVPADRACDDDRRQRPDRRRPLRFRTVQLLRYRWTM